MRYGITLGPKHRVPRATLRHYAVGNQAATIAEYHDRTVDDIVTAHLLDHERISRPNGVQHAPPRDAQAQSAGRAQNFARHFALSGVLAQWVRVRQEAFRLLEHPCETGLVFPHESADVTNTCS